MRSIEPSGGLSQVYQGRARKAHRDIYEVDHAGGGGRFRWLVSTCLAGGVGMLAIGIVIYGSIDRGKISENVFERISQSQTPPPELSNRTLIDRGLNWAMPKSDRLQVASGALTARYIIHEQVRTRRNNRPFIEIRPYLRIVARLAPTVARHQDVIPSFNPFKLYSAPSSSGNNSALNTSTHNNGRINVRVVELHGGILPGEDGQELDTTEVTALVKKAHIQIIEEENPDLDQTGKLPAGLTPSYLNPDGIIASPFGQGSTNTTILKRTVTAFDDDSDEPENIEVRVVRVATGDNLTHILQRLGISNWQTSAILEATQSAFPPEALRPAQEIHFKLAPSLTTPDSLEPIAFSIFDPGHIHRVTVKRDASGEFTASTTLDQASLFRAILRDSNSPKPANLYTALYDAALMQKLPPKLILKILRIHVYGSDFRRRVQAGDQIELFFDLRPQTSGQAQLGELLYTAITSSGETQKFWRFRSQDGRVDYFDKTGQNSKKFLMRKPVRSLNLRLTSGFGFRYHPLHHTRRMHTGVDWAAPRGTPILAAGKGIIEKAGRRGWYGKYVRIRHSNGYQTAYAHMSGYGPGIRAGAKVRQGQIIGYIGSTGLSSGPHLHYEVLVNKQRVNPLKIKVPRARTLRNKQLAAFQNEKIRIDGLMRRPPVKTATR